MCPNLGKLVPHKLESNYCKFDTYFLLGGALKETDTGLWVHLVCALYTPGVAFGELDKLTQARL